MRTHIVALFVFGFAVTAISQGEQVTLNFNPPDGLSRIKTVERTITTDWRNQENALTQEVDHGTSVYLVTTHRSSSGYWFTEVETSISRTINGQPFDNPVSPVMLGRTNTFVFSREGELQRQEGDENLVQELKAVLPSEKHAYLEQKLGGDGGFLMSKRNWDFFAKRFVGRTLKEGDFWKETIVKATTNFMLTGVHKISTTPTKTYVKLFTVSSLIAQEIDAIDTANLGVAEVNKFFKKTPRKLPYYRLVHWVVFDAATLLPIKDERLMQNYERGPNDNLRLVTEMRVETYQEAR